MSRIPTIASRAIARSQLLGAASHDRSLVTSSKVLAKAAPNSSTEGASSELSNRSKPLLSPSPLSPSAPPVKKHSPLTVAIVTRLAKLMGYNSSTTKAIRVTSDLYDRCAERADLEEAFWYGECRLPRTYQVWFQITSLHIYLLLQRFRALPTSKSASNYSQEIINHFFIDAESRMRIRFGVQTARLVKGYMKEMHTQHRGSILSLDEAMSISAGQISGMEREIDADAILAAALWRNIWGAGDWGQGVGGVKRKVKGVDRPDEKKSKNDVVNNEDDDGTPELAQDLGIDVTGKNSYSIAAAQQQAEEARRGKGNTTVANTTEHLLPTQDLEYAISLEKLVTFVRRETHRLGNLSDEEIENGFIANSSSQDSTGDLYQYQRSESIASFSKI